MDTRFICDDGRAGFIVVESAQANIPQTHADHLHHVVSKAAEEGFGRKIPVVILPRGFTLAFITSHDGTDGLVPDAEYCAA